MLLRIKPITCYSYTNIRKTYSRFRNKKITHDFEQAKAIIYIIITIFVI